MSQERPDVLVIGANLRGLTSAYIAAQLGHKVIVLERAPRAGGADGTFPTAEGDLFDHGLHLLDFERSVAATRLMTHAVQGQVRRFTLERGMVLRGETMPYAPTRDQMPASVQALLKDGDLVDDIGDAPPTRANLARCYGEGYANFVLDEVLPSMRTEVRHLEFGVSEEKLLPNVYPWFFPRAERELGTGDHSRRYHDRLRVGIAQDVLYPVEGGFAGFANGLMARIEELDGEVVLGAGDVELDWEEGSHQVREVRAAGRTFVSEQVFWAAAWAPLCKLVGIPVQNTATDRMVLGSFRLDREPTTDYHEILVGDPTIPINRVSMVGKIRDDGSPLLQIENAFPLAADDPIDAPHWQAAWTDALRRIGVITDHKIEAFDFKTFPMHFNAYGMEGEALVDADPSLIDPNANLFPVSPSMANWNTNTYIPRVIREVTQRLAAD